MIETVLDLHTIGDRNEYCLWDVQEPFPYKIVIVHFLYQQNAIYALMAFNVFKL